MGHVPAGLKMRKHVKGKPTTFRFGEIMQAINDAAREIIESDEVFEATK